jgi:hypothetical protein
MRVPLVSQFLWDLLFAGQFRERKYEATWQREKGRENKERNQTREHIKEEMGLTLGCLLEGSRLTLVWVFALF